MEGKREFDVLLWGVTGFTGLHLGEYFARTYPPSKVGEHKVRWAVAGRDRKRVENVIEQLSLIDVSCRAVPILIAAAENQAQVDSAVARTSVVASTVGPFIKFGQGLVESCVRLGTHYCDSTGEFHFFKKIVEAHHAVAVDKGVFIVPCCGFDCVPSDLGVFMLSEELKRRGTTMVSARTVFVAATPNNRGGKPLNGTLLSCAGMYALPRREVLDPEYLVPSHLRAKTRPPGFQILPRFQREIGKWTSHFVMQFINEKIVYRTNALLGYHPQFTYSEGMAVPFGLPLALVASLLWGVFWHGLVRVPYLIPWLCTKLAPGVSTPTPRPTDYKPGSFRFKVFAQGIDGTLVTGVVAGPDEAGYTETSKMVGESAVLLAKEMPALRSRSAGGVLTPAAAFGGALLRRLRARDMTFAVDE